MREVIVGVIGGKRRRQERKRSCDQQQYRKRPYIVAVKDHSRLIVLRFTQHALKTPFQCYNLRKSLPEQVARCFLKDYRIIRSGIRADLAAGCP